MREHWGDERINENSICYSNRGLRLAVIGKQGESFWKVPMTLDFRVIGVKLPGEQSEDKIQ